MSEIRRLNPEQIRKTLNSLNEWKLKGEEISRLWKFKDFAEAMAFVNKVAGLAEAADHHPDIDIRYNKVRLTLSTHSAGGLCAEARGGVSSNAGLTEKDFALARQIG